MLCWWSPVRIQSDKGFKNKQYTLIADNENTADFAKVKATQIA